MDLIAMMSKLGPECLSYDLFRTTVTVGLRRIEVSESPIPRATDHSFGSAGVNFRPCGVVEEPRSESNNTHRLKFCLDDQEKARTGRYYNGGVWLCVLGNADGGLRFRW
jgi:hypothetical protein